ncbi:MULTISPECIES: class I SAM-dependent methyltransferase [unclassified Luteococcus]|uniref:class I SAM-dependent methyltransferase n=1 Tax=unclassified Luteococcus TaxID=2639923 RepID=UPI00313C6FDA
MPAPRRSQFPAPALDWMVGAEPRRVLNLAGSAALPKLLAGMGHQVMTVDRDLAQVARLHADDRLVAIAAEAESLPFDPCQFDVVTVNQVFHRFAPGLVLSEMARVLRPGGHASISYLVRDDSVPWVKRLIRLLRQVDENAMRGDYGDGSVESLASSKYFPELEMKRFRVWQQVDRPTLLGMVANQTAVAALDEDLRQLVLNDAAALYDSANPGADELRLPYELRIWRAWVDHEELTAPIEIDDSGLVIPL